MSYYPEADIHIRKKIKAELDLPNYAAKKEFIASFLWKLKLTS